MSVTFSTKCYTYLCCGCGLLAQSERRDTMTCSTACRVKAHRNGVLKNRREVAAKFDIEPASMGHALAAEMLVPDLVKKIEAGARKPNGRALTFDYIQPDVGREFTRRVMEAARYASDETLQDREPAFLRGAA